MNNISLDKPYLLLIAVPLIVLFTVPFAIAIRKSNRNGHNITSQVLHILIAIIVAFAAAGTTMTTIITETEVYVVADVSHSAKYNLDTVDEYIHNLQLPKGSKVGLVCFGKDYELVSTPGDPKKVPSVKEATVDDTETNISSALTYTGTLFSDNVIKHIVLITDGKQTDLRSESSIRRAVDSLEKQKIQVDAIFLDDNPNENNKEVQISGVELTAKVYQDSEQTARIAVQSSYDAAAKITLKRDGEVVEEGKDVALTIGLNNILLDLDTSEPGTFDYEVSISAAGDSSDKNNAYSFTQTVSPELKVLIVTGVWEDCEALVERYAGKGEIDVYELDFDSSANKNQFVGRYADDDSVNIHLNDAEVPAQIEQVCKYDEIVLSNIDITKLDYAEAFVESIDTAVSIYGKSLITLGDMSIQNRNDVALTQLGSMLPVNYGDQDESRLFTFVIDTSRSMYFLFHLNTVKQVSTRLIDLFNDNDYVCIVKIESVAEVVLPATSVRDRDMIKEVIQSFEVRNGTVIGKGLQRAYEQILPLQYSEKQVMLFTDGLTFGDDLNPETVVRNMYSDGIFTAVFDVGRQGGDTGDAPAENKAAKAMLQKLAKIGSGNEFTSDPGNYFFSDNAEYLDESLFQNVAEELTEVVVKAETSVNVEIPRDEVLEGIDRDTITDMPDISQYVYGGAKPSASTVLTLNHKRKSGATTVRPLYAHWDYGNGHVSTFTSGLGEWTKNWGDKLSKTFFNNVLSTGVPEEKHDVPYAVEVVREGSFASITAEVALLRWDTSATFELTLPNGEVVSKDSGLSGNSFKFEFETADLGKYSCKITYFCEGKEYTTYETLYVCYIEEYDAFAVFEPSELHRAIDGRGTVSTDGTLKVENNPDDVGMYIFEFTVPLLIAAVVLLIVDIIVRKLKWEDIVSFFGGGKKKEVKK